MAEKHPMNPSGENYNRVAKSTMSQCLLQHYHDSAVEPTYNHEQTKVVIAPEHVQPIMEKSPKNRSLQVNPTLAVHPLK